ncbi:MAG: fibronectin type III domain-containing protein [Ruminiclostridium sp.]|nr:fibronectin type III domain-containing protein [Ruminiclostridium sp.]
MKKVRKMLSLLLVGVIAVTSLLCGSVTAGAETNPAYTVWGLSLNEDLYSVCLMGITKLEMNSVFQTIKRNNNTKDNVYAFLGRTDIRFGEICLFAEFALDEKDQIQRRGQIVWGEEYIDIAGVDITAVGGDQTKVVNALDDFPDNASSYMVSIHLSTNNEKHKKIIEEIQKYNKATWAGFGVINNNNLLGFYDTTLDYWTQDVDAFMGTNSKTDSNKVAVISFSKSISSLSFSSISSKAYTGKAIKPSVIVKDGTKTLVKGTDYTLSYKNNKNIGTATVTITGKGSYTGTKSLTFKIIPAKTTLTAKKSNGKYALSWKKVTGITKYQIQYSTDSGKTYKTAGTVSSGKTSATLKLDTSKSYTFRIRSYKTVDGKKYYSSWSKVVSVK